MEQVTLSQAASLILGTGDLNTILLTGAPGIGKSSILKTLAKKLPDHVVSYIDVATLDLGDIAMPMVDRDRGVTEYAPNARFGLSNDSTRPVVIMLDELGKAQGPVLNMLLPLMLERRLNDRQLPAGSLVFGTTNLATDNVGDRIPAHAYNRMTVLDVANPTAGEWLTWAADSDIAPEVVSFARDVPCIFERYDLRSKKADANPYIFDPTRGQTKAFCSPRSLEKASNIIKRRDKFDPSALLAALAGTVGAAAANDLDTQIRVGDALPQFEEVIRDPETARLPKTVSEYYMMALKCASGANEDTIAPFCAYAKRWTTFEAQSLFVSWLAGSRTKMPMAIKVRAFTELAAAHAKFINIA